MESKKQFEQSLCDENNTLSIIVALNYLISTGHYYYEIHPLEQPETFKSNDFVLFLKRDNREIKVEVERKKTWTKRDLWQGYKTLDVPCRKNESKSDIFVMTNNDCNMLAIIKMRDVLSSSTYKKDTIYTKDEKFYAVELNKVKFIKMNWEKL